MALSSKVAALTSLGFIFGMSWLVSLVARPMVEQPTPLVVRGPGVEREGSSAFAGGAGSRAGRRATPTVVAGRFVRASALEAEADRGARSGEALVVAEGLPAAGDLQVPTAPPIRVAKTPVVVAAVEPVDVATELPAAGGQHEVAAERAIPEAIIASVCAPVSPRPAAPAVGAEADRTARLVERYKVRRGDTLVKIMRRLWDSDDPRLMEVLLAANPKIASRRDRIFPGEVLILPVLPPTRPAPGVALATWRGQRRGQRVPGVSDGAADVRWYIVRERDTLVRIARRLLKDEGRWREIATLNQMRNANKILPGTRIKLPPLSRDT